MMGSFYISTIGRLLNWARSSSLWYYQAGQGCCGEEVLNTAACRYDWERFGCVPQQDPRQADLLIINGVITHKQVPYLRALYEQMPSPKYVLAIGSCANGGGPFFSETSYSVVPGIDKVIPVDVFVPGCPPRPEAIMNGLLALQEKIGGYGRAAFKNQ